MSFVSKPRINFLNEGATPQNLFAEIENIHRNITKVSSEIEGTGTTNIFVGSSSSSSSTTTPSYNIRTGTVAVVAGSNTINFVSSLTSSDYGLAKPSGIATDGSEMNIAIISKSYTGFVCWASDAGTLSYCACEVL